MKPEIKIKYGKLLDPFLIEYVKIKYPEYQFPTKESVLEKVSLFKEVWKNKGDNILEFLSKNTGLQFKRNIIDCFIVTATPKDMSSPLVIRSRYTEKEFIYIILHELIHILFSDNKVKYLEEYKNESLTTQNHIQLFLLIKKYHLNEINDPDYLEEIKNKSNTLQNKDYKRAWEIVDKIEL
jgi:hypothetical protein